MKTIKLLLFWSLFVLFATTGCIDDFTISGNGITASEGRILQNFRQVKSEGEFDVHITKGEDYEVIVNAETNILPYIETRMNGSTLRIYISGIHNVKNHYPMEVFISMPSLEGLTQSGSGTITTDYFETGNFNLNISGSGSIETALHALKLDGVISGSGNLTISGDSKDAEFFVSGSGQIDAFDLELTDCKAKISGSGSMWVNVDHYLNASISGSGNVFYLGTPIVEKHISGSGNVIEKN